MSRDEPPRPALKAEILAVGSELLGERKIDTNSLFLTGRLHESGIRVLAKAVVADDRDVMAALFAQALARVDLVILTGGLGPTGDDLTREVVARVLGVPLEEDPVVLERIRRRFERRRMAMPENNRRQALVPRGATVLSNPHGTAPGLLFERDRKMIVLLPGPPRELQPMFDEAIRDRLAAWSGGARVWRREIRITGRTESQVDEVARPLYEGWARSSPPIETTILGSPGQIELHLSISHPTSDAAEGALDAAVSEVRAALGPFIFSEDGRDLEEVVGALLRERGCRIALAESCTGGLLASRLTDVPGSSDYVERGVVTYSNRAKMELLGVSHATLAEHGAVSEAVAREMAEGIRRGAGVELGVGITGIAGPGGGSAEKPVGTVAIALASARGTVTRRHLFVGGRALVKFQASQAALDMVRRDLLGIS